SIHSLKRERRSIFGDAEQTNPRRCARPDLSAFIERYRGNAFCRSFVVINTAVTAPAPEPAALRCNPQSAFAVYGHTLNKAGFPVRLREPDVDSLKVRLVHQAIDAIMSTAPNASFAVFH